MAEDYIKSVIKVDGGEAVKTLKQLRDETKEYQEALLNLDKDSEEYVQIAKQININQKQINEVMSAGKKYTDDAAGSYNALVAEMARLKDVWRATADEVERAKLGERIKAINDQLKDWDASIGNFQRDVGNYGKGWSGLADALGDLSKVGKDAAEGMEGFGKTLGLAGEAAAAFNNHLNKIKAALKIGEAIGKTAQGLKDYAKKSKDAAKAEAQRALATDAATVTTKKATIATKAFGVALKATGIGLLVTLVATLAANWDKVKKAMEPVIGKFEEFGKKVKNVLREVVGGIVGVGEVIVGVVKNARNVTKALVDSIVDWFQMVAGVFRDLGSTIGDFLDDLIHLRFEGIGKRLKDGLAGTFDGAKAKLAEIGDNFANAFDAKAYFKQGQEAGRALFDGLTKGVKQEQGGGTGKAEIKVPVVIDWSKLQSTFDESSLDADVKKKLQDRLNEIYKQDFAQQLADLENEREQVLAYFQGSEEQRLALIAHYGEEEEKLREKINEQISADFNKSLDEQLKAQKEHLEAEKKLNQQRAEGYGYIGDVLGNLGDLFEKDTIAYKAFAVSQALISTYLAGTRVMAEEMGPAWVKIAAMAAVITAGLASVASILSVNEKGTTGGATTSAPSAAAVPVISSAPEISYTRSLTTAADEDRMNQPIYVSVTDINSVQNRVKVRDENASF